VVGDWDGNGTDSVGLVRGGTWLLRNSNSTGSADLAFVYGDADPDGNPIGYPVTGDWDGNGTDTPGLRRDNVWLLRNANSSGGSNGTFTYGDRYETGFPVVGDWNGDGFDTIGLVRAGNWLLRNANSTGGADVAFSYGAPLPEHWPVPGDWDNNNTDTPGVADTTTWYFRNSNTTGAGEIVFNF
jgi:hypothetical protein